MGRTARTTQLGQYAPQNKFIQVRLGVARSSEGTGFVQQPIGYKVYAEEIIRCTALAIRRRAGVARAAIQARSDEQEHPGHDGPADRARNHWSSAYVDLLYGLALEANDKRQEAVTALTRATAAAGSFDHPLTSTALVELGRMQLDQGNFAAARQLFLEATYAGYYYAGFVTRDIGIIEEGFRGALLAHLLTNEKASYAPLAEAAIWAKQKNCRQLHVSVCLSAAEQALVLGQNPQATTLLAEAQTSLGRRAMGDGWIGARLQFLRATSLFQLGQVEPGDKALAAAMAYMTHGSHWLFHIAQTDAFVTANQRGTGLTSRAAVELYRDVLRDPQPADWARDPMESLAVLVNPHPLASSIGFC